MPVPNPSILQNGLDRLPEGEFTLFGEHPCHSESGASAFPPMDSRSGPTRRDGLQGDLIRATLPAPDAELILANRVALRSSVAVRRFVRRARRSSSRPGPWTKVPMDIGTISAKKASRARTMARCQLHMT